MRSFVQLEGFKSTLANIEARHSLKLHRLRSQLETPGQAESDESQPADKLGTATSSRSGTPSEYSADDPDDQLGFTCRGWQDTVWLVRGGPGHGKYRIFAAAIDAGYYDRMPQNVIKLVGDECEFADEWLGRPAKKTGNWAAFKKGVKRSNPFVRWLLVSIVMTVFLSVVYVAVVSVDEFLSCKTLWNGSLQSSEED
ncbi:hypothetical protein CYMTET_44881 [Cymbomonas tetramitiformis]|uniref:Uncharacterized protein n=1 Tax=Cymbomonas tetramitiformis TaxID=36881 RepID=A0AAE0EZ61_9CHLO|nr:hypothetical protein CYMTET_44881 [Cymbomonas tetramitiformis]